MNLYFRFIFLLIKRIFYCKKLSPFDICETNFWVNPFDLDINLHMNNGRYLSIMDLGRVDLLIRARSFWGLLFHGYYPVVVSEGIRFKKALMPFQFFKILTQIDHWDEKDFYIRQEFIYDNKTVAEGYLKARFLHRQRGSISTQELFGLIKAEYKTCPPSTKAEALNKLDSNLGKSL